MEKILIERRLQYLEENGIKVIDAKKIKKRKIVEIPYRFNQEYEEEIAWEIEEANSIAIAMGIEPLKIEIDMPVAPKEVFLDELKRIHQKREMEYKKAYKKYQEKKEKLTNKVVEKFWEKEIQSIPLNKGIHGIIIAEAEYGITEQNAEWQAFKENIINGIKSVPDKGYSNYFECYYSRIMINLNTITAEELRKKYENYSFHIKMMMKKGLPPNVEKI